jgi:hypothetical protein
MSQSYSHPTFDQGAEYNTTFYIVYMTKENSVMQTLWISRSLFRIENSNMNKTIAAVELQNFAF